MYRIIGAKPTVNSSVVVFSNINKTSPEILFPKFQHIYNITNHHNTTTPGVGSLVWPISRA